jgi:hypothetical protein
VIVEPTKNERIRLLEEKVRGLQHQIDVIKQTAARQNEEHKEP